MSWDRRLVAKMKSQVRTEVAAMQEVNDPLVPALLFRAYALCEQRKKDDPELLRAFLLLVTACSFDAREQQLGPQKLQQLMDVAEHILHDAGIKAETSGLGFLYSDLFLARSQHAMLAGDSWIAAGYELAGEVQSRRGSKKRYQLHMLASAIRSAQLGLYSLAAEGFRSAENHLPLTGLAFEQARLGRVHGLRCGGHFAEAVELIKHSLNSNAMFSGYAIDELIWEKACCEVFYTGETGILFSLLRETNYHQPVYFLEGWLWALADRRRECGEGLLAIRTLKNRFGARLTATSELKSVLQLIQALMDGYDNTLPLARRILEVTSALDEARKTLAKDHYALGLAAVARWSQRFQLFKLAAMSTAAYEAESLKMSQGACRDITGLLADLQGRSDLAGLTLQQEFQWSQKKIDTIETGFFTRFWHSSRLSLKAARTLVASPFVSSEDGESIRNEVALTELARYIRDELGDMKGPVMKFGQMLSVTELDMPEEARNILQDLQHSTSFLDLEALKPVIEEDLGRSVNEVFSWISPVPLASASIGQVHRARLITGEDVVVKIQYPGIEKIVRNDLKGLGLMKPVMKAIWPGVRFTEVIGEIGERLLDETDYRIEAKNQEDFARHFAGDSHIRIPKVYLEVSGRRVLTSEFIEGQKLEQFVKTASQEEKDLAGATVFRFVHLSIFKHYLFNADPHPGNMLFLGDSVAFLDFGCVKRYEPEFLEKWKDLIRSALEQDEAKNRELWDSLGYVVDRNRFDYQFQYRFYIGMVCWLFLIDQATSIDAFDNVSHIGPGSVLVNKNSRYMNMPKEHTFTIRLFFGMTAILRQLGAVVNWRQIALNSFYADPSLWPAPMHYDDVKKVLEGIIPARESA